MQSVKSKFPELLLLLHAILPLSNVGMSLNQIVLLVVTKNDWETNTSSISVNTCQIIVPESLIKAPTLPVLFT